MFKNYISDQNRTIKFKREFIIHKRKYIQSDLLKYFNTSSNVYILHKSTLILNVKLKYHLIQISF